MKLKPISCATLVLMLGASLAVANRGTMDLTTTALNINGVQIEEHGVGLTEATVQPPTIIVSCPDQIQVGPVSVPNGWQSLGSLPRKRFSISVDADTRSVVCEYTNQAVAFQSYYLARKIPPGYECKIPFPLEYRAICNLNPRARPKQ